MRKMVHTVIFDIGGTLVDAPDIFKVIAKRVNDHNSGRWESLFKEEFDKLYHGDNFFDVKTILIKVAKKLSVDYKTTDLSLEVEKIYRDNYLNHSSLYGNALWTLKKLKEKNINIIAVTDADSDILMPQLRKLGILDFFQDVLISSNLKMYKTSPNIIKHILPKIKEPYEEILFVGDSDIDVKTAKNLGVKSVLIKRDGTVGKANLIIKDLRELVYLV